MDLTILAAFLLYVLVVIFFGLSKGRSTRATAADFLNSSRDHRSVLAGLSAGAACESGWVLLGLVGASYTVGVSTLFLLPGALIGYVLTWGVVGKRFCLLSMKADTTSTPQTIGAMFPRHQRRIVMSAGLIVLVFMSLYVAAQFNASGKAFQNMLKIPYVAGVWLSMLFVLTYSVVGGTRSVSWTNVIQASMMAFCLIVMPLIVLWQGSHFADLMGALRSQNENLVSLVNGKSGGEAFRLVAGWVFLGIAIPGMPHVLRRFIASKNEPSVIEKGGIISIIWSQIIMGGAIVLGLAARAYQPEIQDPENTLPTLAVALLPKVMAGFMLAAVWAAISSTADAQLVECVSAVTEDIGPTLTKATRGKIAINSTRQNKHLRAWTVALAVLTALLASTENRNIFTLVLDAWNVLGASLAPPILFMLLYRKTSGAGVLSGILGGAISVFLWRYVIHGTWLSPLVIGFIVSSVLILAVSILFPDSTTPKLQET